MAEQRPNVFLAVAIGVSMGGLEALRTLLSALPADFSLPILIVQHLSPDAGNGLAKLLNQRCALQVKEADEGEVITAGTAYLAPANYHLLVEGDQRLALSVDPPVHFARPSVDVLFESAARVFGPGLIGIVLTGAGADGSDGIQQVMTEGGVVVVQDPTDAKIDSMPRRALAAVKADYVLPLTGIGPLLLSLVKPDSRES